MSESTLGASGALHKIPVLRASSREAAERVAAENRGGETAAQRAVYSAAMTRVDVLRLGEEVERLRAALVVAERERDTYAKTAIDSGAELRKHLEESEKSIAVSKAVILALREDLAFERKEVRRLCGERDSAMGERDALRADWTRASEIVEQTARARAAEYTKLMAELDAERAHAAAAEAALVPFAVLANEQPPSLESHRTAYGFGDATITVGDLRAAQPHARTKAANVLKAAQTWYHAPRVESMKTLALAVGEWQATDATGEGEKEEGR